MHHLREELTFSPHGLPIFETDSQTVCGELCLPVFLPFIWAWLFGSTTSTFIFRRNSQDEKETQPADMEFSQGQDFKEKLPPKINVLQSNEGIFLSQLHPTTNILYLVTVPSDVLFDTSQSQRLWPRPAEGGGWRLAEGNLSVPLTPSWMRSKHTYRSDKCDLLLCQLQGSTNTAYD